MCFCDQYELEIVGVLPLFSSRVGLVPSSDKKNEASPAVGDDPKPCPNCLGRDTIANAAARDVGPAVVNLSVPQGIYFRLFYMFCNLFYLEIEPEICLTFVFW
jgi:hypothetical protein